MSTKYTEIKLVLYLRLPYHYIIPICKSISFTQPVVTQLQSTNVQFIPDICNKCLIVYFMIKKG